MLTSGQNSRLRYARSVHVALCLWVVACAAQPQQRNDASPPPARSVEATRYDLKGKVVSIDKPGMRLTVDHEAIAGFMGAMTMAYPVKDERALEALSPGDHVTAKVVSSGGSFWLEDIAVNRP